MRNSQIRVPPVVTGQQCTAWRSTRLSLSSRQYTHKRPTGTSAQPLLLNALDLDDYSVLDDHADLTKSNALDGCLNVIQIQIAGRWRAVTRSMIECGTSLSRHTYLTTRCGPLHGRCRPARGNVFGPTIHKAEPILPGPKSRVKTNIDNLDRVTREIVYEELTQAVAGSGPITSRGTTRTGHHCGVEGRVHETHGRRSLAGRRGCRAGSGHKCLIS